jgi:hypothetical protein
MTIEPGKRYFRKRGLVGIVREVLALRGDLVEYRVLHGPARQRSLLGACNRKNFASWADGEFLGDDFHRLDGAKLAATFVVQNVAGEPFLRCGARRARFYLVRGYAIQVDAQTLRFVDDTTEKKLAELYDGQLGPFFLEIKNDRCVVCGKDHGLTRHHVVPKRHKRNLPLEVRKQLSNVLFVCLECHDAYEARPLVSDSLDPFVWKDHFLATMQPRFLPRGWDIILRTRG